MTTNVNYLGIQLKTPIIVGSCGLTGNLDNLLRMQDAGAGAVILKTKFEEEFAYDIKHNTATLARTEIYGEAYNYIESIHEGYQMDDYFAEVSKICDAMEIPVIGSISCISLESWLNYVKRYEVSGCSAMELTMAMRPYDIITTASDVERVFSQVLQTFKRVTTLPIAVKLGSCFTDMARFIQQLSWSGVHGITMFDSDVWMGIDTENIRLVPMPIEHHLEDIDNMLRWLAILSQKTRGELSAATGIDNSDDVVKAILVGASTTQITTSLYRHGIEHIKTLQKGLEQWMERHEFSSLDQFRGKLAMKGADNATARMRIHAIKSLYEE